MKFEDIHNVAMIGSGTMGAGMSWCFAQAGYNVKLYDVNPQQLERACARIEAIQKLFVQEELISAQAAQAARERIVTTTHLEESLLGVQYVLEAVPERLQLKQQLFAQFEGCCPNDAILATNTSGLRITDIASVCQHPERVGGMHWANPSEIVPLVEVIRGDQTSDDTVDVIYKVTEKLGKLPVVVNKDIPGFVSNRLQYAVLREALHLVGGTVGGGFGSKNDIHTDHITGLVALKTGRPAKWRWTREEDFWVPNVYVQGYCVLTNKPPASSMRGFGITPSNFALELQMDKIAETIGMDKWEIRFKNAYREGDTTATGRKLDAIAVVEVMQALAEKAGVELPAHLKAMSSAEGRK